MKKILNIIKKALKELLIGLSIFLFIDEFIHKHQNFSIDKEAQRVYIRNNTSFDDLCEMIQNVNLVSNIYTFKLSWYLTRRRGSIKPGSYIIKSNESNRSFINKITKGKQTPVSLRIPNIDTIDQLAQYLSQRLMFSYQNFIDTINNEKILQKYHIDINHLFNFFISDTYFVFWDITPEKLIHRIRIEYDRFWNDDRITKAKNINMSQHDITTLASIVEKESNNYEEKHMIAGVYINRLNKKMRLEADPTYIWALKYEYNNQSSEKMNQLKSLYNTYYSKGLPPQIITIPSSQSIDAVLNYKINEYLYFVIDPESSCLKFSKTYEEHCKHVRKYRRYKQALKNKEQLT